MDIFFSKKLIALTTCLAALLHGIAAPAQAAPLFDPDDPFYLPPPTLPTQPGVPIRTAPAPDLLPQGWPARASRILYSSTLSDGTPVAVSGIRLEPTLPWLGEGPRPTLVIAPGTRGAADACAPSRGLLSIDPRTAALGVNYELPIAHLALLAGVRVTMTDYVGLGTPGAHTYVHHREEAAAVLDAARATLLDASADPRSPIGLWGYSQAGGATAAAAEHAASYAPALNIVGTFAGAPPANLPEVIDAVDGNAIFGVLGMAVMGFSERNPAIFHEEIAPLLNAEGWRYFTETPAMCIPDAILAWGGRHSRELSTTGESFSEAITHAPMLRRALDAQRLGRRAPTGPVMIHAGVNDDTIPYPQVRALADAYCAAGTPVLFRSDPLPEVAPGSTLNHALPLAGGLGDSLGYLLDRFHGVPAPSNCGGH